MKQKKFSIGEYVYLILDPKHLVNIAVQDLIETSGKSFRIIESGYVAEDGWYEYRLSGITVWIPESYLRRKDEMFDAVMGQEIRLLEKQIDEAIIRNDEEKFKGLAKKYALLKADYI